MGQDQTAQIAWKDGGIPVSTRFDDPYFSLENGLEETRHVFQSGNDLPARLVPGFHVAELGFGTGLNMLALAQVAQVPVRFTSFEAFPMATPDIVAALAAFPDAQAIAAPFLQAWAQGARRFAVGNLSVEVITGDARETLPNWAGRADAWFLDGFSPAKNPELWGADLMAEVGRHTTPGGTFATYTAAGFVRRGLEAARFTVTRVPGFGRKRHMSVGRKDL
ncbi:tRNA (5-methylaminomethyl-2-thiouridine)(34)-methyltransferase MnmD [Aliiroseovarius subalbicans]|uniref:tRNA (5-methylaminomethyl-2-thiouridine)(34)-methyltransferase MnmD n=1 Tax=Aliiroseovarius subalbicans TaxID=2925840 RepID=UPI001F5707D1|nr:tRNA (5-methylaminomethyl-2-thiouridine)(34)-methyltransferase MnmD [Aliiroseovarius subalbicans]MCI2399749.1 tRNA (5-methylaminomethyl-2-thiouridine)(34)-methyltransferase MnmD [Aliiroseovarius subalbicans]